MIVKSSRKPSDVEISDINNNTVTVVLRRGFKSLTVTDSLTNNESIEYEYEEVRVYVNHRPNLLSLIQSDFDKWFEKGLKLEALNEQAQQKQKEMNNLIKEYGQIEINSNLQNEVMTSFEAVANLYMDNMMLVNENQQLKEDNLLLMESIAELYIMMMGGM